MYETVTYDYILSRMLERVPSDIDKREGSIIYDALAPSAAELAQIYIELGTVMDETFADTASRENLIKRAAERGIKPKAATQAILKGVFNMNVPIGSRFTLSELAYQVIEKIGENQYKLLCESAGEEGNYRFGTIIPVEYIDGLKEAQIVQVLINGEDEESTEDFRERYFKSFEAQSFGGNISDYREKINELQGVGGTKIYPVWNGGGTVKVVILDSGFGSPSTELVKMVQSVIDPTADGLGVGIAPIGHVVTVEGVSDKLIDVAFQVTLQTGWVWADVEVNIQKAIDAYFLELKKSWEGTQSSHGNEGLIIRISQVEARMLAVEGVLDVYGTTLNAVAQNIILGVNEIPKRGEVHA